MALRVETVQSLMVALTAVSSPRGTPPPPPNTMTSANRVCGLINVNLVSFQCARLHPLVVFPPLLLLI